MAVKSQNESHFPLIIVWLTASVKSPVQETSGPQQPGKLFPGWIEYRHAELVGIEYARAPRGIVKKMAAASNIKIGFICIKD